MQPRGCTKIFTLQKITRSIVRVCTRLFCGNFLQCGEREGEGIKTQWIFNTLVSCRFSYMITGANSGIGKSTALALAKKGATVHMVCRNPAKGEEAKQDIVSQTGNCVSWYECFNFHFKRWNCILCVSTQKIQLHLLDLSKPRDIIKFAGEFVMSGQKLDVLVSYW